jgi:hypothetical protein
MTGCGGVVTTDHFVPDDTFSDDDVAAMQVAANEWNKHTDVTDVTIVIDRDRSTPYDDIVQQSSRCFKSGVGMYEQPLLTSNKKTRITLCEGVKEWRRWTYVYRVTLHELGHHVRCNFSGIKKHQSKGAVMYPNVSKNTGVLNDVDLSNDCDVD